MNHKKTLLYVGLFLVSFMILVALFAPHIATQDPSAMSLPDRYQAPSSQHYFGLDENGSDVFSKVVYGARISIMISLTVVSISMLTGLIIGSIAGFYGRWIDTSIMRFIDMMYAFPNFLLALALVAVLGPSIKNIIIAMCLTSWTSYARLVRGEFLHLKEKEYVVSALSMGAGDIRIIVRHIWPNLVGPLVVQSTFAMAGTIIAESGLSFLGLGAPPTEPTWGNLLSAGRKILWEAPHVSIFPGLAIVTLVLGFNFFGDGLRDYLDPKKV